MTDKVRRKELTAQYRQSPPDAGVYLLRNVKTGKGTLGSTSNLQSMRNKLEFAKASGMPGALDLRLRREIEEFGLDAFTLEILETVEVTPDTTPDELASDLATLEALWREKLGAEVRR